MRYLPILLVTLIVAAGCSNLAARRHANELQIMRQDDEYCVGQGLYYPDPSYITCRYQLQDSRALNQWESLQLAQAAAKPAPTRAPPFPGIAASSHILDRDRFRCWPEPQFGHTYIFCGERDRN